MAVLVGQKNTLDLLNSGTTGTTVDLVANANKSAADYLSVFSGNDNSTVSDGDSGSVFTDKNGQKVKIDPKVEKESKAKAENEKQKGRAAQMQGNATTTTAYGHSDDIKNQGDQESSITQSSNASNQQSMQGIKQNTTTITGLNEKIAKNQEETAKLQQERAQLQSELDEILGKTSSAGAANPAASNPTNAAKAANSAGAQPQQGQGVNGNGTDQSSANGNADCELNANRDFSSCSLTTGAQQDQGVQTSGQKLAQAGNAPQKADTAKTQGKKDQKTAFALGDKKGQNSDSKELDKLDPEKRARAEQLMAQIGQKDTQIASKQQQKQALIQNKNNTYNTAQNTDKTQVQVANKAKENADKTQSSAISMLNIAENLHNIAKEVKMTGIAVQQVGHALEAIPWIGPVIGPPVVVVGQITERVGDLACQATEILSKVAGAVKAAVTGDIQSLASSAASLSGTMSQATAAYQGGADSVASSGAGNMLQGAADKLTSAVGDNAVSNGLQQLGDRVQQGTDFINNAQAEVTGTIDGVMQQASAQGTNFLDGITQGGFSEVKGFAQSAYNTASSVQKGANAFQKLASGEAFKSGTPSFGQDSNSEAQKLAQEIIDKKDPSLLKKASSPAIEKQVAQLVDEKVPGLLKNISQGYQAFKGFTALT